MLTDLIDKCPPAEACREAFDRMSKATIKMCMNSTGFGSQVKFAKQHEDSLITQHRFEQQIPPQLNFTSVTSRPQPQFEDNWKELFPETSLAPNGRNSGSMAENWQTPNHQYMPQRLSFSPSDSSTLSNTANSFVAPISNPQQMQQTQQQYDSLLVTPPDGPIMNNVDALPNYDMYDFDFLMSHDNLKTINPFTGDSGLNLGFDAHHYSANAQLPDLFGGFFFGGQANEGADMDNSNDFPTGDEFEDPPSGVAASVWSGEQKQ